MTLDIAHILVAGVTLAVVLLAVTLHYEVFLRISAALERSSRPGRQRVLFMVFALIAVHVVEIWLFAAVTWLLTLADGTGVVLADYELGFFDYVYLSAATFTTVGYGDLVPEGAIRFVYGTEALVGFMLITWSASLTFVEMQRYWRPGETDQ